MTKSIKISLLSMLNIQSMCCYLKLVITIKRYYLLLWGIKIVFTISSTHYKEVNIALVLWVVSGTEDSQYGGSLYRSSYVLNHL